MSKYKNVYHLKKAEQDELFMYFARMLASVRNPVEAAQLIKDLLSEGEALMLARRLKIADLLHNGYTYRDIQRLMRVGQSTIARVQTWIRLYGDGYRIVIERNKKHRPESKKSANWSQHRKKYPLYYWPQLLLEEIVNSASKREKERLKKVIIQLKEKTQLSKQLLQMLK